MIRQAELYHSDPDHDKDKVAFNIDIEELVETAIARDKWEKIKQEMHKNRTAAETPFRITDWKYDYPIEMLNSEFPY